jgi:hypothetical protein
MLHYLSEIVTQKTWFQAEAVPDGPCRTGICLKTQMMVRLLLKYALQTIAIVACFVIFISCSPAWGFSGAETPGHSMTLRRSATPSLRYDQIKTAFRDNTPISNAVVNGDAVVAAVGRLVAEKANCSVKITDSVILGGLDFTKLKTSRIEATMLPDDVVKTRGESVMNLIRGKYGNNAALRYIACNIEITTTDILNNGGKPSIIANNAIFTKRFHVSPQAAGDVVFDGCIFLEKFDMGRIYSGEVALSDSVFYSTLTIQGATFYGPVRLAGLTLFSSLEVNNSSFFRRFDMEGSFLKGWTTVHNSLFANGVSLKKSVFNDNVSLYGDLFGDLFSIKHSALNNNLYVNNTDFKKGFAINNSRLAGDWRFFKPVSVGSIALKDIAIGGRTDFSYVTVGGLEVEKSVFGGSVSFSRARLGHADVAPPCGKTNRPSSSVTFRDTYFGSGLDFSKTRFFSDTVFDGVKVAKVTDFSFTSFPPDKCGIPGISFRRNDLGRLKVKLLPQPGFFKSMEDELKTENRISEARTAHYTGVKAVSMRALTGGAKAVDALGAVEWLFWGAPTGYGSLPLYVLFSSSVSVLFFALFYFSTGCLRIGAPPRDGRRRLLDVLNYPVRVTDASAAGVPGNGAKPTAAGGFYSFAADFAVALRYGFSIFFKVGRPDMAAYGICRWAALCQWYSGFIASAAFIRCVAALFGI